jgi:hypothetical protein
MSETSKPIWTGDMHKWEDDWLIYWHERYGGIYKAWFASDKRDADIKLLTLRLKDYAVEKVTTIHPRLWELGQRMIIGRLSGTPGTEDGTEPPTEDYALAAFHNSLYPKAPLDEHKQPPKGWFGFSVSEWIGKYQLGQVYVSAKECLIFFEKARRRLDSHTPSQVAQAKADCDTYKVFSDYDEHLHLPMAGYPIEYYKLATAHSWGGKMTSGQWQHAAAWLTCEKAWPLLGQDGQPMPFEEGYTPLPPLDDPMWQADYVPRRKRVRDHD